MPMPKKVKKRIIFWSVFLGAIVLVMVAIFVVTDIITDNLNRRIVDAVFYSNNGRTSVNEFASVTSDATSDQGSASASSDETAESLTPRAVYDDEYISLAYVGIGRGASFPFADKQCVIFEVENKTKTTFEFSSIALALDGKDIGYAVCYSKISAKSTGQIYVVAENQSSIAGVNPSIITGSMAVQDTLDIGTFGENNWWHKISFTDIQI